jgi:hypothetical protein
VLRVREMALISGPFSSRWGTQDCSLCLLATQVGFVCRAVTHAHGLCELLKEAMRPWQVLPAVLICHGWGGVVFLVVMVINCFCLKLELGQAFLGSVVGGEGWLSCIKGGHISHKES